VRLIFFRELRDQLRDRRTMFTICVLPMLLYPLMGLMMLQLAQVKTPQRFSIAIVGNSDWLQQSGASQEILSSETAHGQPLVLWTCHAPDSPVASEIEKKLVWNGADADVAKGNDRNNTVQEILARSQSDAILVVANKETPNSDQIVTSRLVVLSNQRLERSRMAVLHLQNLIERWHHQYLRTQLDNSALASELWQLPPITHLDVASTQDKQAVVWSKVLPLIMLVWALTGAFYPAIDLCAGEKERGTLETLLSSPASRREIVWGKWFTVTCFSIVTAILNLLSMVITTSFVFRSVAQGAPSGPFRSLGPIAPDLILWLMMLVIPMSAMFSALALAVASLARSTKEGQYYLMPLLLIGFPLVMLPILPGITLSSGTSIVPVTGAVLLARALMDGEYGTALMYLPSVACVTTLCCLLAIRWAVRQFENESVLFSDVEKGTFKSWLLRFWNQRTDHPTATESVLCGLSILVAMFFGRLAMGTEPLDWASFATSTALIQLGLMLGPTLIMAVMLTRSVRHSLRLETPRFFELIACGLLAVYLHPTYVQLASYVNREYPLGPETAEALRQMDLLLANVPLWNVLLLLAVLPAICEEVVFRGFVFAGLLENKGVLRAVIGSAVLFGLSHGVLQQTICATTMGIVLGWLAYRTGGIACTFAFHLIHNSLSISLGTGARYAIEIPQPLTWAVTAFEGKIAYTEQWNLLSLVLAIAILAALSFRGGINLQRGYRPRTSSRSSGRIGPQYPLSPTEQP
jgi:sodium transport system permease protein